MKNQKIFCHDLQGKQYEVGFSELIFRPSVYGVLIEREKILLSKQWDGYDMPGGGINVHETIEEALKREFFEETGLEVEPIEIIHCETSFFHPTHSNKHKNEFWNCPLIYYKVKQIGGEISDKNFDEEEVDYAALPEWISLDKIDKIKFFNSIDSLSIIKKAFE